MKKGSHYVFLASQPGVDGPDFYKTPGISGANAKKHS